ncbi:division/cell wall cluster transcriptional repressor MraZ [Chondrinema litorale]|uniref:division/cell wall cluster transcriptional repressor MraZ n=1 Tax=Chondrinema litorale TaxID=2994555 RepID=UPI0025446580|nr:division/cell wall cluster transcriptional repressor MraZ [Chondrinema litorale]UZR93256.1 division/cell wall cluster transcriptional repressor MraZ [Chondrinema litorale]
MSYFSSEYECRLDTKGRLVLPARVKSALPEEDGNRIVLKRGFEPCLTVYPQSEWEQIFNQITSLNEFTERDRKFQRMFMRGLTEIELDKTGRFLIPRSLQKYAKLDKDVLIVGLGKRLEIWNPDEYDEYLAGEPEEFSDMAQEYLGRTGMGAKEEESEEVKEKEVKEEESTEN